MAANKHLGKGLDLLLSASAQPIREKTANIDARKVEKSFSAALQAEEEGNLYEAYYLYRRIVDSIPASALSRDEAVCMIVSQALNNAAIILYEAARLQEAKGLLLQACEICPANDVARENLELISQ